MSTTTAETLRASSTDELAVADQPLLPVLVLHQALAFASVVQQFALSVNAWPMCFAQVATAHILAQSTWSPDYSVQAQCRGYEPYAVTSLIQAMKISVRKIK